MGDVVSDLDSLALTLKYTKGETYHNVSMGQGQDIIAERLLDAAAKHGHWVILNNVHLMPRWLKRLEKILDDFMNAGDSTHNDYRLFLTSDPSKGIPTGILNRSIKLTNEPHRHHATIGAAERLGVGQIVHPDRRYQEE